KPETAAPSGLADGEAASLRVMLFDQGLKKYLPRVLPYMWPYWGLVLITVLAYVVLTFIGLLEPWPLKILIDSALGTSSLPGPLARLQVGLLGNRTAILLFAVLGQLGLSVIANLIGIVNAYAHTKLELGMSLDFRGDLFNHAQRLSLAYHDQRRSGMLIYIIN